MMNSDSSFTSFSFADKKSDILRFQNVCLQYIQDRSVFENVSFHLKTGSFHYLTGASGVGKSSLIKLLMLSLRSYKGEIEVFNRNLKTIQGSDIALYRQKIGVVFQDFLLLDHLSAVDNIALPLRLKGQNPFEARTKAQDLLEWIGLKGFQDYLPCDLSGGQKQRLAIARAVINRPPLVIADEPTGNVDDENAVKLLKLFITLNQCGTTVIFATHNRDLVAEFPHPALHLEQGSLTYVPSPALQKQA